MSWSAEELFIRAYAAGAVAVQAVLDATRKLNDLTRPPRRTAGFDEDAAGEYLGGAEQLTEREAEEECSEPPGYRSPRDWTYSVHVEDGSPYTIGQDIKVGEQYCAICGELLSAGFHSCPILAAQRADRGTGAINDGEPQQVTLSGREFERYLDGALNEPYIAPDDEVNRCYFCGDPTENLVNTDDDPEFVCNDCADDTPNPTEPGLDDDELIAVRGLLQERYGRESIGCICPPGLIGRSVACRAHDAEDGEMWRAATGMFQKMTSAPVKSTPGTGAESDAPVASTTGPSGQPVDSPPLSPGCPRSDDAAAEWIGGAVPVISAVLGEHYPRPWLHEVIECQCPDRVILQDRQAWCEHVAPLIANALAPQPKPAFPETGLDMGARLDGASEMFPQHRKTK